MANVRSAFVILRGDGGCCSLRSGGSELSCTSSRRAGDLRTRYGGTARSWLGTERRIDLESIWNAKAIHIDGIVLGAGYAKEVFKPAIWSENAYIADLYASAPVCGGKMVVRFWNVQRIATIRVRELLCVCVLRGVFGGGIRGHGGGWI
jgi:hypothetical protein